MQSPPTTTFDVENHRWLVGPDAAQWLHRAALLIDGGASILRATEKLRQQLPAQQVHLLLQQCELRRRGSAKFPAADQMFFTPLGLQQATDAWVAAYKASRFPKAEPLADLCCGIGGDLLTLAQRGPIWAVDRDPSAVVLARANARGVLDQKHADECRIEMAAVDSATRLPEVAAWHIDPDRRPAGRRTTRVELHDPGPEVLSRLMNDCPNAAIKLAPAATFHEPWWSEAELEWISRDGECRQLVAWFGRLAEHPSRRRATVLSGKTPTESRGVPPIASSSFIGEPNVECSVAANIGRYVYEPDSAVLAAKLEGALAVDQSLAAVAPGVAYYTGDRSLTSPMLAGFEVLEVMPYRVKSLREWLANRGIGRLEVKRRGVPLEPEKVRAELRISGSRNEEATLLLTRIAGKATAIVARRIG